MGMSAMHWMIVAIIVGVPAGLLVWLGMAIGKRRAAK
jgi:hypothetical protein